jgi:hypothetical protein
LVSFSASLNASAVAAGNPDSIRFTHSEAVAGSRRDDATTTQRVDEMIGGHDWMLCQMAQIVKPNGLQEGAWRSNDFPVRAGSISAADLPSPS